MLVGPNNSGKSTVVGALRVLAAGLQRANARRPQRVSGPQGMRLGYPIAPEAMPISVENVHTNYAETDTTATFELSNGARLMLYFAPSGECVMLTEHEGRPIRGPADFKREFPLSVSAVPVLGPVEHEEQLVQPTTVQRNLATHRASRNFRNYWLQHDDEFRAFRNLIRETWPEMDILLPEITPGLDPHAVMFCIEGSDRIQRELYWVGFGVPSMVPAPHTYHPCRRCEPHRDRRAGGIPPRSTPANAPLNLEGGRTGHSHSNALLRPDSGRGPVRYPID